MNNEAAEVLAEQARRQGLLYKARLQAIRWNLFKMRVGLENETPDRVKTGTTETLDSELANAMTTINEILESIDFETGYLK